MSRAVKSISFKLTDPFENKLIEHSKHYPNFSAYVKRLIQHDMEGWREMSVPIEEATIQDDQGDARSFI